MGALHEGHLALVRHAREHAGAVVVSIFVNPLQFNDKKDLERYPRHPEQDRRMLEEVGCDMVFSPVAEELFHDFTPVDHDLNDLGTILEGASRPGHFQGVVNVVERLFHYVRPDIAVFGEKDRQQLAVIRHVAADLRWPVQLMGYPIVRAEDGLALSSRNQRLSEEERGTAPILYQALRAVQGAAFRSPVKDALQAGMGVLATTPSVQLDYLRITHPDTLQPLTGWDGVTEATALIAAQVGPVRLIDNMTLRR